MRDAVPEVTPPPFEPGPALARISADALGWMIDCRGPHGAQSYLFDHEGDAAEFAVMLKRDGGWSLRFRPSAAAFRALVEEIEPYV